MSVFNGITQKVKKLVTGSELINAKQIQNGYFYTFEYAATSMYDKNYGLRREAYGYDSMPVIFCIGPAENSINCFIGLNFNHLSVMKKPFWEALNKKYNITDEDIRHLISKEDLLSIGSGIAEQGIRYYNRKNITNPKRIINSAIPKYIKHDGKFIMTDQNEENSRFSIDVADKGIR